VGVQGGVGFKGSVYIFFKFFSRVQFATRTA
jgi:hypothetical protein